MHTSSNLVRILGVLLLASYGLANALAAGDYRVVEVTRELKRPWSLVFLPSGDMLVSEKTGRLRVVRAAGGSVGEIAGVPADVFVDGDGGLLGLALHPEFDTESWLYFCYSQGTTESNATAIARGRLRGERLEEVTQLFVAAPRKRGASHFGCRLQFLPDGTLAASLGDGFDYAYQAQSLDNDLGKIIRLNADGTVPADNPFVDRWGTRREIYSYGHRNVQGLVLRPGTGELWAHEHGPKGGDELNLILAGANFGWPMATHGVDYSGARIAAEPEHTGMVAPLAVWVPSIAPSGMDFYEGERFPGWRGDLFVGALAERGLRRIHFSDGRPTTQQVLLSELKTRIRDVRSGPDGCLYVLTDEDEGRLLRLEPAGTD